MKNELRDNSNTFVVKNNSEVKNTGVLNMCIEKIGSIELKRLTIIEQEMDKILGGSENHTLFNKISDFNMNSSLNIINELMELKKKNQN